jgi:uncharacterized protein RhaS with RHS repeats
MRARWYDPTTRRFISPDPIGLAAGINQYAFAGGDPINESDHSGVDRCGNPDDPQDPEGCAGGDISSGTTWPGNQGCAYAVGDQQYVFPTLSA